MNLIEESFQTKKEDKSKKMAKIVLIFIVLIVLVIIGIVAYMIYIEKSTLKVSIDGRQSNEVANLLKFEEDGTIYVPIRKIATYLGYQSYNGEYSDRSEDSSKCYIQSESEIANFQLNKNKVYKLNISNGSNNYEYFYTNKPVKAINGELHITTDGMKRAFNTTFNYDKDKNRIEIYTMPYLIQFYEKSVLDYGYNEISKEFTNQKTILADTSMLIVKRDKSYGVIETTTGNSILEPKYDKITYLPYVGDFLVESNKKVGIMSADKEIKVDLLYDSIELMDIDAGLYLVKKDKQCGVIDMKGNTKIYIENDNIGIDVSRFEKNDVKSRYILVDNLIPVQKNGKWGLYDKTGKKLKDFIFDGFGYVGTTTKDAINLLVIPEYNVIVASRNKKYTLINSSGEYAIRGYADDIYMTINSNQKHYYMNANDKRYDVEQYLDNLGVNNSNSANSTRKTTNSTSTSNNNTTNRTNSNEEENEENENNENEEENEEENDDNEEEENEEENNEDEE